MTAITPELLRVALVILERAGADSLPGLGGAAERDKAPEFHIAGYADEIGVDAGRLRALAEGGEPATPEEGAAIAAFFERHGVDLAAVQRLIDQNAPRQ